MTEKIFCWKCGVELRDRLELMALHMMTEHGAIGALGLAKMDVRIGERERKSLSQVAKDRDITLLKAASRARHINLLKTKSTYCKALKIVAGIPDNDGKTYGSILHGHESEFIQVVLSGKSIEEAFGIVKGDVDADMQWIRDLADEGDGDVVPLDELRKTLGERLKEPLSEAILQERYGAEYKAIVCRQCRKELPDHGLVMVVKHMIEEHGADTVDKLKMLRIGFGEKPRFNEDGTQVAFPAQMFLYQFAEKEKLGLEQALKNAKCLAFMEEAFMEEAPLKGSIISGADEIEPLDLALNPPVSIAYICAGCGKEAQIPADGLLIDVGTIFTCEGCEKKTVVSMRVTNGSCLKCQWLSRQSPVHRFFCTHKNAFKTCEEKRQIGMTDETPSWCPLQKT